MIICNQSEQLQEKKVAGLVKQIRILQRKRQKSIEEPKATSDLMETEKTKDINRSNPPIKDDSQLLTTPASKTQKTHTTKTNVFTR